MTHPRIAVVTGAAGGVGTGFHGPTAVRRPDSGGRGHRRAVAVGNGGGPGGVRGRSGGPDRLDATSPICSTGWTTRLAEPMPW